MTSISFVRSNDALMVDQSNPLLRDVSRRILRARLASHLWPFLTADETR